MIKIEKFPTVQADFRYLTYNIVKGLNLCSGKRSKLLKRIKFKNLNKMKTATLLVLLAICTIPAFSQPPGGGRGGRQMTEEDVTEMVERTADSLNLTAEQEKKVLEFELEFYKERQKLFENFDRETGDREAMREKMMQQRDERDKKYAEVLTDEQLEKFQEMQDRRRQNMRQRREDGSGGDRGRGRGRG